MLKSGHPPEELPLHWHWDWTRKEPELRMLAVRFYGVQYQGKMQGLMKLETTLHRARLPEQRGKPLVYIDYIEVAPWNIRQLMVPLGREPELGAIGTRLVEAAARRSIQEGFKGRVGLHSLPTSERFYLSACGMTGGERDIVRYTTEEKNM